jgi:CHAT domain-containing protein
MIWFGNTAHAPGPLRTQYFWVFGLLLLLVPFHCARTSLPQADYELVLRLFQHGSLKESQDNAERGRVRFLSSHPEWALRFQYLEAEAMVWRGMYEDALGLLSLQQHTPRDTEDKIQKLTAEGITFTHLKRFSEANQSLAEAGALCAGATYPACGNVLRVRGILAVEQSQFREGQRFFMETQSFARAHHDRWLESVALLNLGWASIQNEHFDEAVDWSRSAYAVAVKWGEEDLAQRASGNLGWSYLRLGDAEDSLKLLLDAKSHAATLGDTSAEINWMTTTGFVYMGAGKIEQAKQTYQDALEQARKINSKEHISDLLTNLALVAVISGNPTEADAYANQALAMARQSESRADLLDCFAVLMQAAALRGDTARAEQLLQEVMTSPESQTPMKWESEDAIAKLYESQGQLAAAQSAYRSALTIFEAARDDIHHEDSQLPFVANATRIYDDYIHFLVAQGKTDEALVTADQSRARTLAQGLGLTASQRTFAPASLSPRSVAGKAGATLLFYWLGARQSYLWAVTPEKTALFTLPAQKDITPLVERYRRALLDVEDPLESGNSAGRELYTMLVAPAAKLIRPDIPIMILTDGALSQLNFETLIVPGQNAGQKPHYWIDDATVMAAPSLAMLAAAKPASSVSLKAGGNGLGKLLLLGDAISPSEEFPQLPFASLEMRQIERHFAAADEVVFAGERATPRTYASSDPRQFSYIHFVSHGVASRTDPLDSAIILSRPKPVADATAAEDSFKLYARELMQHPIDARLVTISACNGSGVRAYAGEGLVGLSWAFLRAGAHSAIGGLWEVSDESTPRLMDALYEGLQAGQSPALALRQAKLNLLHSASNFRKPFYWAPFQIYTRM